MAEYYQRCFGTELGRDRRQRDPGVGCLSDEPAANRADEPEFARRACPGHPRLPSARLHRATRRGCPDQVRARGRRTGLIADLMAQEYSPTEIFKRATAATVRAIAERDDLTVGFGPEAAGLSGTRVRLPLPAARSAGRRGGAGARGGRQRRPAAALSRRRGPQPPRPRQPGARHLRGASSRPGSRRSARAGWPGSPPISPRCSTSNIAARASSA